MKRFSALAIFLVLVTGCGPETIGSDWHKLGSPVEAPAFTLPQLNGPSVSLSDLRGRVVIIEFWATWCGPCRMSLPSLEAIYRQYRNHPVTVLLINAGDEPVDRVREWAGKRYTAPILLDTTGDVRRRYGVSGIPKLVVIDPSGRLLYHHSGYGGGLEQNLRLILKELLGQHEASRHV